MLDDPYFAFASGVSDEVDERVLTTEETARALDRMDAVGLFEGLSLDDRRRLWATLMESEVPSADLLLRIPALLLSVEWQSASPPHPYADLLRRFAAVSRGGFTPTDIADDFAGAADSVRVAFSEEGFHFEATLPFDPDWSSSDILRLIAEATADSGGQLYRLGRSSDRYVFLTEPQRSALADLGVLPEGMAPVRGD